MVQGKGRRKARRASRVRSTEEFRQFTVRMVRAYGRRVAETGHDEDIAGLARLAVDVDAIVAEAVRDLHYRQGFTWQTIADALGVTPQAVRQRWAATPTVNERVRP